METKPLPLDRMGQRFSIRLHEPDGGYRDVVGILKSQNTVINRHGNEVNFDPTQIFTWREVIERPRKAGKGAPLTLRVMELDQICNATWPAVENQEVNGWLLRASHGVTKRANSILPLSAALGSSGKENFTENLAAANKFYQDRNLPIIFQLALPTWQELAEQLITLGAVETIHGHTMVADLTETKTLVPTGFEISESKVPSPEWLRVTSMPGIEKILLGCSAIYLGFTKNKKIVATARIAITNDWSSITRVYVDPEFRSLGLGKAIVTAALAQSFKVGATKAVLQVEANNEVAIGIYESLGFNFHHEYLYLELNSDA